MKTRVWMTVGCMIGMSAAQSMGEAPVIASFQGNGHVAWTNAINTNAIYSLEWAAQAGGPWHSFTYQPINIIDAHSGTAFRIDVPMFYRVVMATNEPPRGMVWIDAGDVQLGDARTNNNFFVGTAPVHTNYIGGFWMDATEVTKAKWDEVYNWAITNGYFFDHSGSGKASNHPVQTVNWYDCVKWCNARSQKEKLTPCYYYDKSLGYPYIYKISLDLNLSNSWVNWSANGYRLPTEAEWEKAARGGRQGRLFPWGGDTIQHARANYYADTNSFPYDTSPTQGPHPAYNDGIEPYTSPAGSFPANGYGLYDMAGNVQEWCWDWWGNYSASYQADPHGPASGWFRVYRGGASGFVAEEARCADRLYGFQPSTADERFGFRCVRGP